MEELINTNAKEGINYTGIINVTVKNGNTIISKKTYHNKGGTQLFNFLSTCLVGDSFNKANAPRYIKLFSFAAPSLVTTDTDIIDDSVPLCASIYLNASEVIKDDNGNPAAYLHFTIPCSAITNSVSGEKSTTYVYQAGLYSANYAKNEYKTNYSAAFNFASGSTWDPIVVSTANGDYNIFIEWTLSFSNN